MSPWLASILAYAAALALLGYAIHRFGATTVLGFSWLLLIVGSIAGSLLG